MGLQYPHCYEEVLEFKFNGANWKRRRIKARKQRRQEE